MLVKKTDFSFSIPSPSLGSDRFRLQRWGFVTSTNNPDERYNRELIRKTKAVGCFESLRSIDNLMFLETEYPIQYNYPSPTEPDLTFTSYRKIFRLIGDSFLHFKSKEHGVLLLWKI